MHADQAQQNDAQNSATAQRSQSPVADSQQEPRGSSGKQLLAKALIGVALEAIESTFSKVICATS